MYVIRDEPDISDNELLLVANPFILALQDKLSETNIDGIKFSLDVKTCPTPLNITGPNQQTLNSVMIDMFDKSHKELDRRNTPFLFSKNPVNNIELLHIHYLIFTRKEGGGGGTSGMLSRTYISLHKDWFNKGGSNPKEYANDVYETVIYILCILIEPQIKVEEDKRRSEEERLRKDVEERERMRRGQEEIEPKKSTGMDSIKTYRTFCIQAFKDGKIIQEERDFLDNQARRLHLMDPEKKQIEDENFANKNTQNANFEEYRQQAIAVFRKGKVTQEERALLDILGINSNLTKEQQKLLEDEILKEQKGEEMGKSRKKDEVQIIETCDTCHGSGAKPGTSPKKCSSCHGSGQENRTQNTPFGRFMTTSTCGTCRGAGTIIDSPCSICHGSGNVQRGIEDGLKKEAFEKLITITIPDTIHLGIEMLMEIDIFNAFEGTMDYLKLDFSDAHNGFFLENDMIEFGQLKSKQHVIYPIKIIPAFEGNLSFSIKIKSSYGNIIKDMSIQVGKAEKTHGDLREKQPKKDRDLDDWLMDIDELKKRLGVEGLIALIKCDSYSRRIEAIEALGVICDERAVEPMITVLGDEDVTVRQLTVITLGNIGDKRAVEPLINLLYDNDFDVRLFTIYALGNIGDSRAVEPLITALEDNDTDVRMKIIGSLGMIGDKKAVQPLLTALREDVDQLRDKIIWALGEIGDKKAVNPLLPLLVDKDVQNAAAIALGKIGDKRAVEPLICALEDEDVQNAAAIALGDIGDIRAVDPLILALGGEDNVSVIEALSKIGDKKAIEPLIKVLCKGNVDMRRYAVEGLGKIRDEGVVEHLILALEDEDLTVRCKVVEALGKIGDKRAVDPLISALGDEYWEIRLNSIEALGKIGDVRAIPALEKVQKNPEKSREDQQAVVKAFVNIRHVQEMERNKPILNIHLSKDAGFKVGYRERLITKVSNVGQSNAKNVTVSLSGQQLECNDKKKTIQQLQGGDSFDIEFNIKPIDPGSIIVNFEIQYEYELGKLSNKEEKLIEVAKLIEQSPGQNIHHHYGATIGTQITDTIMQHSNIGTGVRKCSCRREVKENEKICPECGARVN